MSGSTARLEQLPPLVSGAHRWVTNRTNGTTVDLAEALGTRPAASLDRDGCRLRDESAVLRHGDLRMVSPVR
jgi:hypothetical protein